MTGSHNPPQYNGFKLTMGGQSLCDDEIQALKGEMSLSEFSSGTGEVETKDIIEDYVHDELPKFLTLMANTFFSAFIGLASIFAVLKISFGG